jgi:hypothetical protein
MSRITSKNLQQNLQSPLSPSETFLDLLSNNLVSPAQCGAIYRDTFDESVEALKSPQRKKADEMLADIEDSDRFIVALCVQATFNKIIDNITPEIEEDLKEQYKEAAVTLNTKSFKDIKESVTKQKIIARFGVITQVLQNVIMNGGMIDKIEDDLPNTPSDKQVMQKTRDVIALVSDSLASVILDKIELKDGAVPNLSIGEELETALEIAIKSVIATEEALSPLSPESFTSPDSAYRPSTHTKTSTAIKQLGSLIKSLEKNTPTSPVSPSVDDESQEVSTGDEISDADSPDKVIHRRALSEPLSRSEIEFAESLPRTLVKGVRKSMERKEKEIDETSFSPYKGITKRPPIEKKNVYEFAESGEERHQ